MPCVGIVSWVTPLIHALLCSAEAKRSALYSLHARCNSHMPPLSPSASATLLSPRTQQRHTDAVVNNNAQPGMGQTWKCSVIRGVVGVSGPYDLVAAAEYLHGRGLHRALVRSMSCIICIMCACASLVKAQLHIHTVASHSQQPQHRMTRA